MSQEWTRDELRDAALVLTVTEAGENKWSSSKSSREVASMLRGIAEQLDIEAARAIAGRLPKISNAELDWALDLLNDINGDDSVDPLVDALFDERDRREDDEPHDDTPSLDLPTYGA